MVAQYSINAKQETIIEIPRNNGVNQDHCKRLNENIKNEL